MSKQYSTEDLLHLANLGRFGSPEMNALAHSAFVHIKALQDENTRLKKMIEEKEIKFFQVQGAPATETK
jgi:hypothetical protein